MAVKAVFVNLHRRPLSVETPWMYCCRLCEVGKPSQRVHGTEQLLKSEAATELSYF